MMRVFLRNSGNTYSFYLQSHVAFFRAGMQLVFTSVSYSIIRSGAHPGPKSLKQHYLG